MGIIDPLTIVIILAMTLWERLVLILPQMIAAPPTKTPASQALADASEIQLCRKAAGGQSREKCWILGDPGSKTRRGKKSGRAWFPRPRGPNIVCGRWMFWLAIWYAGGHEGVDWRAPYSHLEKVGGDDRGEGHRISSEDLFSQNNDSNVRGAPRPSRATWIAPRNQLAEPLRRRAGKSSLD